MLKVGSDRLRYRWWAAVAGLAMAITGIVQPALAGEDGDATACQRGGLDAERKADLPPGLLHAIGLVESGRLDPATGQMVAWPWTTNANGAGRLFESQSEALAETRALQRRGVTSIDVGCFQINLLQHPGAFASLEEAFDPSANAAYAARFLLSLRARTGSWENAIAAYHSATPELGHPYRDSVLAGWSGAGKDSVVVMPPTTRVLVWTPSSAINKIRIWRPSAPGSAPGIIVIRESSNL
jgi:Transglycosylase SLT domain